MWIPASLPITQFSVSYGTEDRRPKPDVAAFLPLFMDVPNKKASKSGSPLEALLKSMFGYFLRTLICSIFCPQMSSITKTPFGTFLIICEIASFISFSEVTETALEIEVGCMILKAISSQEYWDLSSKLTRSCSPLVGFGYALHTPWVN